MSLILLAFCGLWGITAPIHFSHPQKSAVFTPQNCPHCGQKWSARRKKAPGFSPAFSSRRLKFPGSAHLGVFHVCRKQLSPLPFLPIRAFSANAPARRRNARLLGFRRVHARLCPESRTNCRHGRDRLGLAFWLCVQPVFSMKPAYFLLAASSSSFRICRS